MDEQTIEPPEGSNIERRKVINIYTLFGVTLLSGLVPHWIGAVAALILLSVLLIWAYSAKGKFAKDGFGENHMIFVIRTIWIGSFFSMITILVGTIYMMMTINHSPLMPCMQNIMDMAMSVSNLWNLAGLEDKFMAALEVCKDDYIQTNLRTLIISGLIVIGPIIVYFGVRFIRGVSNLVRGTMIAGVKGWF